jgi:hypothetical protein
LRRFFWRCEISDAMIFPAFAKKLTDHFFHGHFLNINIAYIAGFEQLAASLGDFCARDL